MRSEIVVLAANNRFTGAPGHTRLRKLSGPNTGHVELVFQLASFIVGERLGAVGACEKKERKKVSLLIKKTREKVGSERQSRPLAERNKLQYP